MSHPEEYDLVVLGSGRARSFAWSLASQGKRVAVVERRNLAGSCPTIACAPSKNVIHGAKVANYFRRGAEFGIAAGDWKVEMPAVRDRKRKMVDGIVALNVNAYRESGAELVKGQGRFVGPRTIEVTADDGTRTLRGEVVVICTGSRARIDPIPGLAESRPMTHIEALELDRVPKHLLVLGGGYVGLEMAQALRRFGSRVTVIERNDALAHREDRDVSEALRELFDDEGIGVRTGTRVDRVEGRSGESVRLHATHGMIEGSDLLVASGRTPNTDGIGLETAGIERDDRGYIKVDERLRTTAASVWAVGDCAGSPHFTHIADDDVRVIRDTLAGIDRDGPSRALLPVHRPRTGPHRPERVGGKESRDCLPAGEDTRGRVHTPLDALRIARLLQDSGRRRQRPHPGLHRIRARGRRGHDDRSISDDRRPALHGVARCDPGPPDDGGRARQAFPRVARQALTQSADTY